MGIFIPQVFLSCSESLDAVYELLTALWPVAGQQIFFLPCVQATLGVPAFFWFFPLHASASIWLIVTGCLPQKVCHSWLSSCHFQAVDYWDSALSVGVLQLGPFLQFFKIILQSALPSKTFNFFCLVLSEISSAKLSFEGCITSESAWIMLDDLPIFISFNYMRSSVSSPPESTFPRGCAPSGWQIPCMVVLTSNYSMSKVLLKSRRHDSYYFFSIT